MNEKELVRQYLSREIDNLITSLIPNLSIFSSPIKNYILNYIDPYIDLFFVGGETLNTDMVRKFTTQEVTSKINDFIDKYEKERNS
jgi:hypothetical protein